MAVNWLNFRSTALIIPLALGGVTVGTVGVFAQVIPDHSLGRENSVVTPINASIDQIDGGATRGDNLFHSFQEFSIPEGRRVDFTFNREKAHTEFFESVLR
ncbi:MAG: filamentous hemagglutinin N-terminal domain-containing protein [Symploca sp. SIO1B1]|nr:filamentous hemagglutinin N-terminal domain-containing protein [Symploca sp. SIO1B1]